MSTHRLVARAGTTVQHFSRDHDAVLEIRPGDTLTVGSLDASGYLERPTGPDHHPPVMFPTGRGHCLTGPIAVTGVTAGDVLAVRFDALTPGAWGWTVAGGFPTPVNDRLGVSGAEPARLIWELDAAAGTGVETHGFERRLAPFLGVVGLAPAEPGEHSTIPPRPGTGGNIDCRELVAGSTLYLPVQVDGALLYLGDGHAAQGDGEVGGTAIECPMTTELTVDLASDRPLRSVHAETPAGRVTFGFSADLNEAMGDALDDMVTWMAADLQLERTTALALASTCVDLRVTQVANQTWGVHAVLPPEALRRR